MELISCENCSVVIDADVYGTERQTIFNHDQDKQSEAMKCPVCGKWVSIGKWEDSNF